MQSNAPAYLFLENSPITWFDPLGLKSNQDIWKDIVDAISQSKDISKEITDALKNGKATGATPKAILSKLFGVGKLTDGMVNVLIAFPSIDSCSDMIKAAVDGNICYCDEMADDCALQVGIKSGSGTTALVLEDLFSKKICGSE